MPTLKDGWKNQRWLAGAVSAFLGLTIFSSPTTQVDGRGSSPHLITVSLPKLSPAMAAMEDTFKSWSPPALVKGSAQIVVKLEAHQSALGMLQKIRERSITQSQADLQPWLATIPLGGRLSRTTTEAALAPAPTRLKGLTIRKNIPVPVLVSPLPTMVVKTEVTPHEAQKMVDLLAAQDWRQPRVETRVRELIQKEAGREENDPQVRHVGSILVAAPPPPPSESSPPPLPNSGPPTPRLPLRPDPDPSLSLAKADEGLPVAATLSGIVQMADGLALTHPRQQIVVYRDFEGLKIESGQVWLNEGRFEIATRSLRGRLIGQLQSERGEVLGQGELRLASLTPKASTSRIEDLKLTLRPVVNGARIEVISAHSYQDHIQTVEGTNVWMMGAKTPLKTNRERHWFQEGGLEPGSSFVARAMAENHWGTLVVGVSRQETRARLFPNKLMEALLNLTLGADRTLAERSGVIWGRIIHNGQPVTGARIEMAGDHRHEPVYFNSLLLPDRYADATGENGTFAFVWVTPGIQSVRVIHQGRSYPAQVIPVEVGHVSYLEFELGEPDSVPLEIADPLDGSKEIQAMLRVAGDESTELDIQGRGRLALALGPGLMMLEADAGEHYELMRYSIPRASRFLHLPVVRRDWLLSVAARRRVNLDAGVGTIVGFAINDDFVVRLEDRDEGDGRPEIIYFDSRGQAIFGEEGVAGGGFVIFNVRPGLSTVTVSTKSSQEIFSQVVVPSAEVVNALIK